MKQITNNQRDVNPAQPYFVLDLDKQSKENRQSLCELLQCVNSITYTTRSFTVSKDGQKQMCHRLYLQYIDPIHSTQSGLYSTRHLLKFLSSMGFDFTEEDVCIEYRVCDSKQAAQNTGKEENRDGK